jgi:hypothetical protein
MKTMDISNITVGLIGIISFIVSIWIWMRSDMKIRELTGIIDTIHDITGSAIWEWETTITEDSDIRLRQAEKILGFVSSIRQLAKRYSKSLSTSNVDNVLGQLIERGIIVPQSKIWDIETAKNLSEIWLVTPDLKPDNSQEAVGKIINQNITKQGKRYVYFFPENMPHIESEIERLYKNIGVANAQSPKHKRKLVLVRLKQEKYRSLFPGGNVVFYFQDEQKGRPPRCFEEIVLTQVSQRGAFWQEHSEVRSNELRRVLEKELKGSKLQS